MRTDIDITFDFRRDTPEGRDPDTYSQRLHQYHRLLWSKPLPSGDVFRLDDARPRGYLQFRSPTGAELWLSSDAVIPTFKWASHIKELIPAHELEAFNTIGYTIGGMMIFPGVQIDRQWTINQARGCTKEIRDRRSALRCRA